MEQVFNNQTYECANNLLWIRAALQNRIIYELFGEPKARCSCAENEKPEKGPETIRFRPRTQALRRLSRTDKCFRSSMTQVPLAASGDAANLAREKSIIMLEVGAPGDTWRYCIERQRLADRSEWFRALLLGPLAPSQSDTLQTIRLQHIDKRAFDHLLRFLHDEPVKFQSVSTARATLDVAHQYLCPELARLAVEYLESRLRATTVLEVYQGLSLFASDWNSGHTKPTPSAPGDDVADIAATCNRLLSACLKVIDAEPEKIFCQECFEELSGQEVMNLASRDSLRLRREGSLFSALERWASSECRRHGIEPNPANKRTVLTDEILFCVRYLLMSDKEFIEGPMASGMLTSEESAVIVSKILGHSSANSDTASMRGFSLPLSKLSIVRRNHQDSGENGQYLRKVLGKKEREDNKKNRRKECATAGDKACNRVSDCCIRVLACIFD